LVVTPPSLLAAAQAGRSAVQSLHDQYQHRDREQALAGWHREAIWRVAQRCGISAVAEHWAKRICMALLAEIEDQTNDVAKLVSAVHLMSRTASWLDEEASASLVDVVFALDDRSADLPDAFYTDLATLLRTPHGKHLLRDRLVSPDGHINLPLAKVCAWLNRKEGRIRRYLGDLRQRRQDKTGDLRAQWDLACAYAVGLTSRRSPRRTNGNDYIRQALAQAETDPMRIRCIDELVSACRAAHVYAHPIAVIESMVGQFGPDDQAALQALQQVLQEQATERETRLAELSARRALSEPWQRLFQSRRSQPRFTARGFHLSKGQPGSRLASNR